MAGTKPGHDADRAHSRHSARIGRLCGNRKSLVDVERRGATAYVRDRAIRVLLVFLVFLYPTKLLLAALWIRGGLLTDANTHHSRSIRPGMGDGRPCPAHNALLSAP